MTELLENHEGKTRTQLVQISYRSFGMDTPSWIYELPLKSFILIILNLNFKGNLFKLNTCISHITWLIPLISSSYCMLEHFQWCSRSLWCQTVQPELSWADRGEAVVTHPWRSTVKVKTHHFGDRKWWMNRIFTWQTVVQTDLTHTEKILQPLVHIALYEKWFSFSQGTSSITLN